MTFATYSGVFSRPSILNEITPASIKVGNELVSGQILRAQQILDVVRVDVATVADQIVGEPAGLGALPAVGAPPSERLAGQTLSRVGDAQGAVDERFERQRRWLVNLPHLADRQLAGHHHAIDSERSRELNPFGAGQGHLGRRVNRQSRGDGADESHDSQILHQHRVDAGRGNRADYAVPGRQFAGKDQGVERDIPLHATMMQESHHRRQFRHREVGRARSGIEARH